MKTAPDNPEVSAQPAGLEQRRETITIISRVTWVGFWINAVLCVVKVAVGFMSNSRAVVADGVHSLSDLITDVAVLIGVHFWMAPADADHPYGHQRLESLVALSIGILLAVAGLGIAYDAIAHMGDPETGKVGSLLALGVICLSFVAKELLFRWTLKKGREIKSSAVEANAWDHRSDALSSLPTLLAVAVAYWRPEYAVLDFWAALLVACFIVYAAYSICKPAVNTLLDKGADEATKSQIIAFALTVPGILEVHQVRTRYLGQELAVDMHARVQGDLTVYEGNILAHSLEDALCSAAAADQCGVAIISALVHIDPHDGEAVEESAKPV